MQHLHDQIQDFNPRSPWGERHLIAAGVGGAIVFQSTLPVGGSDEVPAGSPEGTGISIHAPSEGSDLPTGIKSIKANISIHAPRGGSDKAPVVKFIFAGVFQSTLPVGGATGGSLCS